MLMESAEPKTQISAFGMKMCICQFVKKQTETGDRLWGSL